MHFQPIICIYTDDFSCNFLEILGCMSLRYQYMHIKVKITNHYH